MPCDLGGKECQVNDSEKAPADEAMPAQNLRIGKAFFGSGEVGRGAARRAASFPAGLPGPRARVGSSRLALCVWVGGERAGRP